MMSVNDRKVFVMALMLMALMSIFVSVASAGESQDWYLRSDWNLDKTNAGTGSCIIPEDPTTWKEWEAGAAQCDLTMGAGTWVLHLDFTIPDSASDGGRVGVQVKNKEDGTMLAHEYDFKIATSSGAGTKDVIIDTDCTSVGFNKGEHLMIAVAWNADPTTSKDPLTINCGVGKSTLSSPSSDPGYPVPELSTLALFSVGLLALVGYVVYRRRNI